MPRKARPNNFCNEDYTAVSSCTAQLYVFTDEKVILRLELLALKTLQETLKGFAL